MVLSDLCTLTPDPEALLEVIMANLGEAIELGNGLCVHLGEDELELLSGESTCEPDES